LPEAATAMMGLPPYFKDQLVVRDSVISHPGSKKSVTFADVVKCTCHLANIDDFDKFDGVYRGFFSGILPARTTVQSVLGGIKVEIDAVARKAS